MLMPPPQHRGGAWQRATGEDDCDYDNDSAAADFDDYDAAVDHVDDDDAAAADDNGQWRRRSSF